MKDADEGVSAGERAWVELLKPKIDQALRNSWTDAVKVGCCTQYRLPYAFEIFDYQHDAHDPQTISHSARYATDLLIYDERLDGSGWVPRVIIECKRGQVTTHDALTYSTKASTHKHVHPYLRYGIVIGDLRKPLPPRLVRHGAYFDFMTVWDSADPPPTAWDELFGVLALEVQASRDLHAMQTDRGKRRQKYRMLHRPLVLK
jgi:hypothetical protein